MINNGNRTTRNKIGTVTDFSPNKTINLGNNLPRKSNTLNMTIINTGNQSAMTEVGP
ncbi:hypothetical protein D3C80_1839970 [compost metagenome]